MVIAVPTSPAHVTDTTSLNNAIFAANNSGSDFVIILDNDITLDTALSVIDLQPAVHLTIEGGTHTLSGDDTYRGFSVKAGTVDIQDLTISHATAIGVGGLNNGSGGSAGLGGALYVAAGAEVALTDVSFSSNSAVGGDGAAGAGGGDGSTVVDSSGGAGTQGDPNGSAGIGTAGNGLAGGDGQGGGGGSGGDGGSTLNFMGFDIGLPGQGGGDGGAGGFGGGGGAGGGGGGGGYDPNGFGSPAGGAAGTGGAAGFGGGAGSDGDPGTDGDNTTGGTGGSGGTGGGGLGAGGNIFVEDGGTLTITGGTLGNGTATGGSGNQTGMGYGSGIFIQGDQTITFGTGSAAGDVTKIDGVIADQTGSDIFNDYNDPAVGNVEIAGLGTVWLTAQNHYTGLTTVTSGTLRVDGSIGNSEVQIQSGAELIGAGTVGDLTVQDGGSVSPGAGAVAAILTTEDFDLQAGSEFEAKVGIAVGPSFDQLQVHGTVTLAGKLELAEYQNVKVATGVTYEIIDNRGGAVTGAFSSIDGGNAGTFSISYAAGDGNDVVITALADAPVITSDGGGATASLLAAADGTVTTVVADDPDKNDTVTFSIVGGADAAKFVIDAATGELAFKTAPDFAHPSDAGHDNHYDVVVKVEDTEHLSDTQALDIAVADHGGVTIDGTEHHDVIAHGHPLGGKVPTSEDDILRGRGGDDVIRGYEGADRFVGGHGADDLHAGKDDDEDVFVFRSAHASGLTNGTEDRIFEFDRHTGHEQTWDRIDLSPIDADKHQDGDQALRFVDHFSKAHGHQPDGEVMVQHDGKDVQVLVDVNGDKDADMIIQVMDVSDLHKADFLL